MANSRNFEFRVSPDGGQRGGRYVLDGTSVPLGVPVVTTGDVDALGRNIVTLATGAQDVPASGSGGILDYEEILYNGVDPVITTYSDLDTAPAGAAVQVVSGGEVKVAFKNTEDGNFFGRTGYPAGRVMVAGAGIATPTIAVDDLLTPGDGNDTDGYWAETSTASEAWLVVTNVNNDTGEVECRVNFH